MDNTQKIQKFNALASLFSTFGKAMEKSLATEGTEKNTLVCELADMLIDEVNEIKNSFGCEIKK